MNELLKKMMGEDNPLINTLTDDMLPPFVRELVKQGKVRRVRIVTFLGGPLDNGHLKSAQIIFCDAVILTSEEGLKVAQECIDDVRLNNEKVSGLKAYLHFAPGFTLGAYIDPELKTLETKSGATVDVMSALKKYGFKMDEAKIA